jgi:thiol-disulfide isomerase/thioredoxin
VSPLAAAAVLAVLVLLAVALGVLQRSRAGRLHAGSGDRLAAGELGDVSPLGDRATLLQLSTPTCARCPGTARLLREVAGRYDGVAHVEVDLTRHPGLADRFKVLQTPTTLLVDADRRVRAHVGGPPRVEALEDELETLLGGGPRAR